MANEVWLGAIEAGATGLTLGAGSVGAGNPGALFVSGHRHVWAVALSRHFVMNAQGARDCAYV